MYLSFQKLHHKVHHYFLFIRLGFCNHDCKCNQGVVFYSFNSILKQQTIFIKKIQKHSCGNSFVAIAERVIFCDEIQKIRSECYPNSQQLAYDFGVSISTISRDIDYMKNRFDAPIEYDAKKLLVQYEGTPVYDEISNVIEFLIDSQTENNAHFLERIAVPPRAKILLNQKNWKLLLVALNQNSIIEFDYTGRWKSEKTHRRVHPYQILIDDGVCYLFGFSEERNSERLFVISRMEKIYITKETFQLPEDFEFSSRCKGGRFGAFKGNGKVEKVKVEFYDDAREWVKERIWADNQKIEEDEYATTITFSSNQTLEVLHWILSQGHNAKPLEPEWLVDQWKFHIKQMSKLI